MMCANCSKLAWLHTKKKCTRCQGDVATTIAVICEVCSLKDNVCSVCLKKIAPKNPSRGCGCGKK